MRYEGRDRFGSHVVVDDDGHASSFSLADNDPEAIRRAAALHQGRADDHARRAARLGFLADALEAERNAEATRAAEQRNARAAATRKRNAERPW